MTKWKVANSVKSMKCTPLPTPHISEYMLINYGKFNDGKYIIFINISILLLFNGCIIFNII